MFSTRHIAPPVLTLVTVLAVVGCAAADDGNTSPGTTDTVRSTLLTDPSTFDPARATATDDYQVARLLYDTLLRRDDGNRLVGGLARTWESVSASEYVLTLRDDATCSDGTPITAEVVAASLSRFMDPATGSSARSLAFGRGQSTVTADDAAGTVRISLTEPWSDLLTGLTLPQSGIVCPAGLADLDALAAGTATGAFSGPYTLAEAQPAVSYRFDLRDDYDAWPEFSTPLTGTPAASVALVPLSDDATTATQLLAGALDVAPIFDDNVARLETGGGFDAVTVTSSTSYVVFNEREGTIFHDNRDLRLTVARLIDPEALNDIVTSGRGEVLHTLASNNVPYVVADSPAAIAYDPNAAGSLAGVHIAMIGTTAFGEANDYIAEVLRAAGATVDLSAVDNATWSTTTGAGGSGWDLTLQGDVNAMGTLPSSLLRVMGPTTEQGGRSKTGADNAEGYSALQRALAATDDADKAAAFAEAQESVLARVDALPLVSSVATWFSAPGFSVRAFGDYVDISTLRLTD
ncbi:ABC transporter substrate-binding protein [Microbacterium sp. SORGH_AS_0888]|uniref:ABC transporter substrate-binding protein n=1 Tax=Microbacterium sp. SORGH_AS_0888 TaxID=3041791 RepID=UPI0027809BC7|nr:ABC transporter substrate-binding protein [Microbacterium sp. SORGH_AS_0888]MDQ1129314.1 peptide/nickel transport system substrate-binding protein [Microbacterium sp. SORGH_AS_0888]